MRVTLVHQLPPAAQNPRNSEGAFLRGREGELLFAYSRYRGESFHDHAACDIAVIASRDEGRSWSEPHILVPASVYGVRNVMSVSALVQRNGDPAFYYLIKEKDGSSTLGRTRLLAGGDVCHERCRSLFAPRYYVVNNDRLVRLRDGRILAPASYISTEAAREGKSGPYTATLLISEDDGDSFFEAAFAFCANDPQNRRYGLQEPGVLERADGSLYFWMRTNCHCQYESISEGDVNVFTSPRPSCFTSPRSPMQIKRVRGVEYAIYNPIPCYNGRAVAEGTAGRTPFVLRKSTDGGKTYGSLNVIEDDPGRGYCYPAITGTEDGALLLAYCRGSADDGNTLCRLGIARIETDSVE